MATDKQSAEKEYTVEEKLSTLYQLQTMMTEIDKIKTLRGELPLEVQDLEDEIAGLETRLQNYQSEIKDFENAVVEQKHKITESTGLIEKYKAQLDNVRNNREFDNLSKEIEFQGLEIEFSEKKIREFGEAINRKKEEIGLAVVYVQRGACGGCFNKIPPQKQLDIKLRKKVIVCEYCGRIMIDPELAGIEE